MKMTVQLFFEMAHQGLRNIQGLLTGIRLRDQQTVDIHTQGAGIGRLQRMLDVDVGGLAAGLLCRGDHVQRKGGFTRGFRTVDLYDPSFRHAADAQGQIQ